jgi:hypothetical protein
LAWTLVSLVVLFPFVVSGALYFFKEQLVEAELFDLGMQIVRHSPLALYLLGGAAGIMAYVWLLRIAFTNDVIHGVLGLLCGLYLIFYGMILAPEEAASPLYLLAGGFVLGLLAYAMKMIVPQLV